MTPKKNTLPPLEETIAKAQKMVSEPITSSTMSPASPVQITPPTPGTQATSMLGEIQSSTDAFTEKIKAQREQAQANLESAKSPYQDFLGSLRGETGLTAEAYDKGGVNTAETELNDINQQIRNEQRALENTVRNLEEKGGGLQGGMQAEINNARRQSLRTQADLYVIQQGVQGKYDSAKAIADRAVSAYLEDQRLELDALKFNYDENKDLFTTAEQREFDVNFDTRKRALDKEEVDLKTISDLSLDALQNGAPKEIASQMRQAKTPQEAMEIGGQYIGALDRALKNAQLAKAYKELSLLGEKTDKEKKEEEVEIKNAEASVDIAKDKITLIDALKKHKGMAGTVGAYGLARFTPFSIDKAEQRDFIGSVDSLTNGLTLDNLIEAKARGATFGALTTEELRLLANSATKINSWRLQEDGRTIGYEASEEDFTKELTNIQNLTRKALVQSGETLLDDEEANLLDDVFGGTSQFDPSAYFSTSSGT